MSVRKHGKRWQVRVTINGQRIEETLPPGAGKADAQLYEAKLRRETVDSVVGRPKRQTIGDLLDGYEKQAERLKSYDRDLRYRIEVLRGRFGSRDSGDAESVAESLGGIEKLSCAGRNRYLAILRRACKLGKVGAKISLLPGESRRSVYLTREQVDALAKAAGRWGDLIRFLALTGLRRGEVLRLAQEDIVNGCIVLGSDTKSGRGRVVPMPPEAARIAKALPFGITATNLNRVFRAARTAAGLPHVRLHDIRRSYGTWLAHSGAELSDIRDLLGHSSISQTNTYIGQASVPRLRKTVKGLKTA